MSLTALAPGGFDLGEVELTGAWHLHSPNSQFGSYSALLALPGCQFLSASDTGRLLRFPMPGCDGDVVIERFAGRTALKKKLIDIESLTHDPETGRIWVGYEGTNTIERLESDLTGAESVRPDELRAWPSNSGPEAMARLSDGRFIVIAEGSEGYWDDDFSALLFNGDPIENPNPSKFRFEAPAGYRPVDATELPDGRVLVLVRDFVFGVPPTFNAKLVVADPAEIEAGGVWRGAEIATISDAKLEDNYEGVAVVPRDDGALDIWLISDDNGTSFQRTMLLKLKWNPEEPSAQ
ncbi:esterase-like activity of phytase family protein [Pontixanthobacter aestiaquae]|uniref:Esterase-like activity of phytase family protein n=1 Tax=Pontixanthobacter aestiaquae TaxID=1509367 RepID=A0A844Z4I5_9SPHN|nr:esterase-like activity of phytase family protein [Pontixanthobacter aestiaquae]MDN3646832.1 esterase-like activity of phytase family protein [Pontixanthobacter aestiaquae]MXO82186.1 esterase-like activity of phytase family protein [Pontixanthobacter aestiaquae]